MENNIPTMIHSAERNLQAKSSGKRVVRCISCIISLLSKLGQIFRKPFTPARGLSFFLLSASIVFLGVGFAKVIASFHSAAIMTVNDPVTGLKFKWLLLFVGTIEIATGLLCLSNIQSVHKLSLIGSLSIAFVSYRFGMWILGWTRPCACLGSLTGSLHITEQTADRIAFGLLFYLVLGTIHGFYKHWKTC